MAAPSIHDDGTKQARISGHFSARAVLPDAELRAARAFLDAFNGGKTPLAEAHAAARKHYDALQKRADAYGFYAAVQAGTDQGQDVDDRIGEIKANLAPADRVLKQLDRVMMRLGKQTH